ncbi:MAG TPA: excinuclease ABC subunit A [Myxococcales bacterium]|nr:excinuclease ABC subunit A [Myxococcales bacterium]
MTCNGLGIATSADPDRLVPNPKLSVRQGAIAPWSKQVDNNSWTRHLLEAIERDFQIDLDTPWQDLKESERKVLLYGADRRVRVKLNGAKMKGEWAMNFEGALNQVERRWRETSSVQMRAHYASYFVEQTCPSCKGQRIRPESAAVQIAKKTLPELVNEPVDRLLADLSSLALPGNRGVIASQLLKEITGRLKFLVDVGLGYLNLSRSGQSLSGGEAQRIRLASQVGSELTGVLYILDEPSIGLHPRDTQRLLTTLKHLRDIGNSVLVVEHDADTIRSADHLVDFGPKAGIHGGEVVAQGQVEDLIRSELSVTGQWLAGHRKMPKRCTLRTPSSHLKIVGAREHNLRGIDVELALGCLTVVTGVSGAGKSTLINGIVVPALKNALHSTSHPVGAHERIEGGDSIDKVIEVDQRPIGRTPRSNPATYTKVWDKIRTLFAGLPDAKVAGYAAGRFSFNVKGGRCETCKGDGVLKIEMHFLADVYVPCEICEGRRFNNATLAVRYKGRSIADVLESTVDEALELFANHRGIKRILQTLQRVGLGYLTLGQSAPTLSGGEAQRLKLARELAKSERGHTMYVLDEPTTGLHFEDVRRLLEVLNALVDRGASVLVIEHNLEVIAAADQIIDLGPEGGAAGGDLVAWGSPSEVRSHPQSHTGAALRQR